MIVPAGLGALATTCRPLYARARLCTSRTWTVAASRLGGAFASGAAGPTAAGKDTPPSSQAWRRPLLQTFLEADRRDSRALAPVAVYDEARVKATMRLYHRDAWWCFGRGSLRCHEVRRSTSDLLVLWAAQSIRGDASSCRERMLIMLANVWTSWPWSGVRFWIGMGTT